MELSSFIFISPCFPSVPVPYLTTSGRGHHIHPGRFNRPLHLIQRLHSMPLQRHLAVSCPTPPSFLFDPNPLCFSYSLDPISDPTCPPDLSEAHVALSDPSRLAPAAKPWLNLLPSLNPPTKPWVNVEVNFGSDAGPSHFQVDTTRVDTRSTSTTSFHGACLRSRRTSRVPLLLRRRRRPRGTLQLPRDAGEEDGTHAERNERKVHSGTWRCHKERQKRWTTMHFKRELRRRRWRNGERRAKTDAFLRCRGNGTKWWR